MKFTIARFVCVCVGVCNMRPPVCYQTTEEIYFFSKKNRYTISAVSLRHGWPPTSAVATWKNPFLRPELLLFERHVLACHHPHVDAHTEIRVLIPFVSKDNLSADHREKGGRKHPNKSIFSKPIHNNHARM